MNANQFGVRHYMGLTVVVAVNLAVFGDVSSLLLIPSIAAWLTLLNLIVIRLCLSRAALSAGERAFSIVGLLVSLLALPFNNDPRVVETLIQLYRFITHDDRIFHFNNTISFLYLERATLYLLIFLVAIPGGVIVSRMGRHRRDSSDKVIPSRLSPGGTTTMR